MDVMLGIDTGGTYTDGVLLSSESKEVIRSAKAFTTKHNLIEGIENCLEMLNIQEDEHVSNVCLSTTLATNAVVENKGANVGLFVIGEKRSDNYPAKDVFYLKGKMTIMGTEIEPISVNEVQSALKQIKGKVDGLTISGYASVRNPAQELHVKTLAEKVLDVPIVCGHELTSTLGFHERTVTAVLNTKLIPVIKELIIAIKQSLEKRHIEAPLIIMKGDGHLMIDTFAESCPIETIMSGPAASMIGGGFLARKKDGVIVDIGGTTTDIVFMDNGEAVIEEEGAYIEGWLTRVRAVKVNTFGFGGDSRIHLNLDGEIRFGPDKVIPLCRAVRKAPGLYDELREYDAKDKIISSKWLETDCFVLFKDKNSAKKYLTDADRQVLRLLSDGPHSLIYIQEHFDNKLEQLNMEKLISLELIQCISLTPTDILHATGEFIKWSKEGAEAGCSVLADRMNICLDEFLKRAEQEFIDSICFAIVESALRTDDIGPVKNTINYDVALSMIKNMADNRRQKHFSCKFSLKTPIIGVGAPAETWIKKVAAAMGAEAYIPEHAEVANAVGTMTGCVQESLDALIQYDPNIKKYIAHLPNEREMFNNLQEAKQFARESLKSCINLIADRLMIKEYDVAFKEDDFYVDAIGYKEKVYVKTVLSATIKSDDYLL